MAYVDINKSHFFSIFPTFIKIAIFVRICFWIHEKGIFSDSDVFKNTHQLIWSYGYYAETHTVETEDGFLIDIFRIPRNKESSGPPVIVQHGLLTSSESWVLSGPGKDLVFLLSDAGFDVWITNSRCNHNARLRKNPPPGIRRTDFSFEEIGLYDLKAFLDYIPKRTGYKQVSFIGHSMACTMFIAGISLRPEYNTLVNYFVALAPVTIIPTTNAFAYTILINTVALTGSWGEYVYNSLPPKSNFRNYLSLFVVRSGFAEWVVQKCLWYLNHTYGKSSSDHYYTSMANILANSPVGLPHYSMKHYWMNALQGKFLRRHIDEKENYLRYNSTEVPAYDTSKVTVPSSLYYGETDDFITVQATKYTASLLPNVRKTQPVQGMNHFDLIWAKEAMERVYKDVVHEMLIANNLSHNN